MIRDILMMKAGAIMITTCVLTLITNSIQFPLPLIIITSHRLIACWEQLRLLLGSTCSRSLSFFSFLRTAVSAPFPSNVLTDDALTWYE